MNRQKIGILTGILAGISFGLIPLFSIPVLAEGMAETNILIYRFLFGSVLMLAVLLYRKVDMRLVKGEMARISILSLFYIGTAITTLESYKYLSSGVATALVYTDPIWCALIGVLFLRDTFLVRIAIALIFSTMGVIMLTGMLTEKMTFSLIGLTWGLLSGLFYALYIIFIPRLRIAQMPSLKLTFYVFVIACVMLSTYEMVIGNGIQLPRTSSLLLNLVLLGLIPTALSNVCVTISLKMIDCTVVAILGALEPATAMVIGILVFGDPLSILSISGLVLILFSVAILSVMPKPGRYFHFLSLFKKKSDI